MAITNPGLLAGVDTNGTNQGTPDTAIITDGYTFQSIPKSADMNRYFKELYRGMQFTKEVGVWQYDASVSYSKQARIMRDQNIYRSLSDANQGNDPLTNPSFWQIDQWRMNTVTHNITVDSDYTLTSEQNNFGKVIITDAGVVLTTARNIIMSDEEKDFIVKNDTAQTLTVKTSGGTGIALLTGTTIWLLCDGTNVILASDGLDIASTAEAQAQSNDTKAITPLKLFEALQGANQSLAANGYQKLPGGLIIQWGQSGLIGNNAYEDVTLPITFPNAIFMSTSSVYLEGDDPTDTAAMVSTISTSAVRLGISTVGGTHRVTFIAIGY